MHAGPITKEAITARLRLLLTRHANVTPTEAKKYASHSLRRGGATYYHAIGVSDADLQELGRWKSEAFKMYTEPIL